MLFPGKDLKRPRLLKVFPWLQSLDWILAALLLISKLRGINPFPSDASVSLPSVPEIIATLIFSPILLYSYVNNLAWFPKAVLTFASISVILSIVDFVPKQKELMDYLELIGELMTGPALGIYIFKKWKPNFTT